MHYATRSTCLIALLAVLAPGRLCAQAAQTEAPLTAIARLREYRFGSDRSALDAADAAVRAAMSDAQLRKSVARALAEIAASDAAFDARQAACRRLIPVAGDAEVPVMMGLLSDERMSHYAIMVLDRINSDRVAAALSQALPRLKGGSLLAAIDILGERKHIAALDPLIRLLRSTDREVGARASDALTRLGIVKADAAAIREFGLRDKEWKARCADGLLRRADELRTTGRKAEALPVYAAVDIVGAPETARAAAFRGRCLALGDAAIAEIAAALDGGFPFKRRAAAALARDIPGQKATAALTARLPRLSPRAQVVVLDALAARGDRSATGAVQRQLANRDPAVRVSAIRTLGALGGVQSVAPLLGSASSKVVSEADAAAKALAILGGEGVYAALARALDSSEPGVQAASIRALTARGASVPLDRIRAIAASGSGQPREAALETLRALGRPQDADVLLDAVLRIPVGEDEAAIDALVQIGRRDAGQDVSARVRERLNASSGSGERAALLRILGGIGGSTALQALTEGAKSSDAEVQLAAVRALAEWPDASPIGLLLDLTQKPPSERIRAVALRGYLRMIVQPESGVTSANAADAFESVMRTIRSVDEKKLALAAMAGFGSERILDLAMSMRSDESLRGEAELSSLAIAQLTAGAWPDQTRSALERLSAETNDEQVRSRSARLLETMRGFGDFVMAWELSPAYVQDGATFAVLFDVPFAPEEPAGEDAAGWRAMPVGGTPEQPWLLDLLAVHGGEQKVAYIRTAVWSETERDLVAEIGTDDGLKFWWNGKLAHSNNTQRAVAPAQEKAPVRARAGWNRALIKVTQNVMGWGACVRFTEPDGRPAVGLRYMLPSSLPGKVAP